MKYLLAALCLLFFSGCSFSEQRLYQQLSKSTFKVNTPVSVGTAFVVNTSRGPIAISAGHVCQRSFDGTMGAFKFGVLEQSTIKIKSLDLVHDLCAMEAPKGIAALDLAKGPLTMFQPLYGMGYPRNTLLTPHSGNLLGAIPDPLPYDRSLPLMPMEETTIQAHPGDSGGPVVDSDNHVVGVMRDAMEDIDKSHIVTRTTLKTFIAAIKE